MFQLQSAATSAQVFFIASYSELAVIIPELIKASMMLKKENENTPIIVDKI